jgi:hypothetical protein
LGKTAVASSRRADGTVVARHHCRDDDLLADPVLFPGDDPTAYLMTKGKGRITHCGHAVIKITQVGMTYATTSDLNQHLASS